MKTVRIKARTPGAMTAIARLMGYDAVTDVPESKYPELADQLVTAYGERRARGMIRLQILYRKKKDDGHQKKFEKMEEVMNKRYSGEGWTQAGYSP